MSWSVTFVQFLFISPFALLFIINNYSNLIFIKLSQFFRLSKSQQHLSDSYDKFTDTKSYQSRSSCALYSPPPLTLLPDPLPYVRGHRSEADRLNILDWPDPSQKYCSVQNLDTVSGLVEIVEDNWPLEENRSLDCIYTQVNM